MYERAISQGHVVCKMPLRYAWALVMISHLSPLIKTLPIVNYKCTTGGRQL